MNLGLFLFVSSSPLPVFAIIFQIMIRDFVKSGNSQDFKHSHKLRTALGLQMACQCCVLFEAALSMQAAWARGCLPTFTFPIRVFQLPVQFCCAIFLLLLYRLTGSLSLSQSVPVRPVVTQFLVSSLQNSHMGQCWNCDQGKTTAVMVDVNCACIINSLLKTPPPQWYSLAGWSGGRGLRCSVHCCGQIHPILQPANTPKYLPIFSPFPPHSTLSLSVLLSPSQYLPWQASAGLATHVEQPRPSHQWLSSTLFSACWKDFTAIFQQQVFCQHGHRIGV